MLNTKLPEQVLEHLSYIMCSKLEANELCIIAAAKPESKYIQVEKDVLA